jgi:NAD(P)-dependent dehydrogenase (short-subunit alcohol dehydrogenase family)
MSRGAIFITGASTGIGRATAIRLANAGYTVIPGLRRDEPLPAPVSAPVLLDLADPTSIAPACKDVLERADGNLVGLVNNAGMSIGGVFEGLTMEDWRGQFEVNLFGHIAITRALFPGLLSNKGRIVTVGSIGGRMSLPYLGPYTASKFAVRGWMDSLRSEISSQGMRAVLIEPGSIATPLWEKGTSDANSRLEGLPDEMRSRYEKHVNGALHMSAVAEKQAIPPDRVAKVIEQALTAQKPKGRYLVGPDAHIQAVVAAMPTRILDGVMKALIRPRDSV